MKKKTSLWKYADLDVTARVNRIDFGIILLSKSQTEYFEGRDQEHVGLDVSLKEDFPLVCLGGCSARNFRAGQARKDS